MLSFTVFGSTAFSFTGEKLRFGLIENITSEKWSLLQVVCQQSFPCLGQPFVHLIQPRDIWEGKHQLRTCLHQTVCRQVDNAFSCLSIDVGGCNSVWAVLPLGKVVLSYIRKWGEQV